MELKRLRVSQVRSDFWDTEKQHGKWIPYYSYQTYGGLTPNDEKPTTDNMPVGLFLPDGNLVEERNGKRTVHKQWLQSKKPGPYKRKDRGSSTFYYLTGQGIGPSGLDTDCLQICSGPLNVLSQDCMDEVHLWVVKK